MSKCHAQLLRARQDELTRCLASNEFLRGKRSLPPLPKDRNICKLVNRRRGTRHLVGMIRGSSIVQNASFAIWGVAHGRVRAADRDVARLPAQCVLIAHDLHVCQLIVLWQDKIAVNCDRLTSEGKNGAIPSVLRKENGGSRQFQGYLGLRDALFAPPILSEQRISAGIHLTNLLSKASTTATLRAVHLSRC